MTVNKSMFEEKETYDEIDEEEVTDDDLIELLEEKSHDVFMAHICQIHTPPEMTSESYLRTFPVENILKVLSLWGKLRKLGKFVIVVRGCEDLLDFFVAKRSSEFQKLAIRMFPLETRKIISQAMEKNII